MLLTIGRSFTVGGIRPKIILSFRHQTLDFAPKNTYANTIGSLETLHRLWFSCRTPANTSTGHTISTIGKHCPTGFERRIRIRDDPIRLHLRQIRIQIPRTANQHHQHQHTRKNRPSLPHFLHHNHFLIHSTPQIYKIHFNSPILPKYSLSLSQISTTSECSFLKKLVSPKVRVFRSNQMQSRKERRRGAYLSM